jgi:NAD+ synthase
MTSLNIDPQQVTAGIVAFLRQKVEEYRSDGIALGLSGGVDSAVLAALVARAIEPSAVHALNLYDRDSDPRFLELARDLAEQLGIRFEARDISAAVREQGAYASSMVRLARRWPGVARRIVWVAWHGYRFLAKENPFNLVLRQREPLKGRLARGIYDVLAGSVENSFSARHITRRRLLEGHAEKGSLLAVGAANRTEWLTGWFVKDGIDDLPIEPLLGLYKTQVYQLARFLEVPAVIVQQAPSPDMLPGLIDEAALGYRYETLDAVLSHLERGTDNEATVVCGVSPHEVEQIRKLWQLSAWKRSPRHEYPLVPQQTV